jgi:hypothetical protein
MAYGISSPGEPDNTFFVPFASVHSPDTQADDRKFPFNLLRIRCTLSCRPLYLQTVFDIPVFTYKILPNKR